MEWDICKWYIIYCNRKLNWPNCWPKECEWELCLPGRVQDGQGFAQERDDESVVSKYYPISLLPVELCDHDCNLITVTMIAYLEEIIVPISCFRVRAFPWSREICFKHLEAEKLNEKPLKSMIGLQYPSLVLFTHKM